MSIQDPISDMLTNIRNGQKSKKTKIYMYSSNIRGNIASILKKEGFIKDFYIKKEKIPILTIILKYFKKEPVIEKIVRVSKPSLRIYRNSHSLPKIRSGIGMSIISTSKGIMTDCDARKLKIGGEVLFYIT